MSGPALCAPHYAPAVKVKLAGARARAVARATCDWPGRRGVRSGCTENPACRRTRCGASSRSKMQSDQKISPKSRRSLREAERQEAINSLRENLRIGITIYTVLRRVSASGMSRCLDLYYVDHNEIARITWSAARVLEWTYDRRKEALRVNGCGMDMGYHAVHCLGRVLFGDGYALKHRWL